MGKGLDTQMASKHMKRCSSLINREIKTKTTVRYHLTAIGMDIIKSKVTVGLLRWYQLPWRTVWSFLKKLNTEPPNNPPLLGMSPKNWKQGLEEVFVHQVTAS